MADIMDYIDWRGDIGFDEVQVNEVDGLIFSQLIYVQMKPYMPDAKKSYLTIKQLSSLYCADRSDDEIEQMPNLFRHSARLLQKLAHSRRYADCILRYYIYDISEKEESQFSAVTIELPDGTYFISYSGTDHSVVGWKENFNLSYLDETPGQNKAKKYLKQVAAYICNDDRVINEKAINDKALDDENIKDLDLLFNDLNLQYKDIEDGQVEIDKYHSLYLENFMSQSSLQFNRDQHFQNLISHIEEKNHEDIQVPEHYKNILRDYQVQGFQWLKTMSDYGFGGILADDMGLGKTLQVMTLIEDSISKDRVSLVVAPATLIYNWQDEIKKFSNQLKTVCITGNIAQRKKLIENLQDYDVVITSYDYIRRDFELYKDYQFYYFILDEAQYIKNQSTKNAQAVKLINGKYRFALTGTPIENSLAELWSIFDFLMPQYLYNYHHFKETYEIPIIKNEDQEKQAKLKRFVEPFILRRTKKDVLTELPDKIENNVLIPFTPDEEKVYLANLSTINTELQSAIQVNHIDKIQILAMMTRLRQLCCDQRILYNNVQEPSSKLKACMDIIETAKENEQKILLFSSFTKSLDLIEAELRKKDISYYVLTGATTKIKRHQLVNAFQNDKTTVFLISLKAGGTGLNLTSASTVIHFDPWWNMSAQNQATDRAYRIGQTNNVQVYKLIMKNSIEEKIQKLQEQKQDLSNMFIENNHGSITQMSTADIIDLFK